MNYSLGKYYCTKCRNTGVFIELAYWVDGTYRCPKCFSIVSEYVDCDNSIINKTNMAETDKVVMIVIDGLYIAGVQRHCLELLDAFKQKGFITLTVAMEGGGIWYREFLLASDFLYVSTSTKKASWQNLRIAFGPEVLSKVVLCSSHLIIPTVFSIKEMPNSIRLYVNLHSEPSEHEKVPPNFFKKLFSKAECVIFPAASTLIAYQNNFELQDEKCYILNNGLSRSYYSAGNYGKRRSNAIKIVIISRIDCDKFSFTLFTNVLDLLKRSSKDFKIRIAGNGDSMCQLNSIIKDYNIKKEVEILGFIESPMYLYKWADIVFLPSKRESMPYVLIESSFMRKPIVLPKIGYMQEQTINGVFCYEPENAEEAYKKILEAKDYHYNEKNDNNTILETKKWREKVFEVYQVEQN